MRYSFEIYQFLSFATKIGKDIGKVKPWRNKYRQNLFNSNKKAAEVTGDLKNHKIVDVVAKSYNDIKNPKKTLQIPKASLQHLCISKNKDGTSKESYISKKKATYCWLTFYDI